MSTQDLVVQWAVAGAIGLVVATRRRLTLFHPETLYLAFHVLAFCLRPTLIAAFDLDTVWRSMLFTPEPAHLQSALWISSAGLAAFCAGSLLASFRSQPLTGVAPPELDRSELRALLVTSVIACAIACAAWITALRTTAGSGYAMDLVWIGLPVAVLAIFAARWRWWGFLPLAVIAAARGTIDGTALTLVSVALLAILLHLWSHQRRQPSIVLLAACGIVAWVALIFSSERPGLAGWFAGNEAPQASEKPGSAIAEQLDRREFAHFDALTFVVATVPEKSGTYSHGEQHIAPWSQAFGRERAHAPASRRQFGVIDLDQFGRFRDLPVALVSDGWMSGGWVGIVVTLGLAGLASGAAFGWFSRHQGDPVATCLYLGVHTLALSAYASGTLAVVHIALILAAPLLFWRFLSRRFRAGESAAADRERLREERQRRRLLGTALLNPHAAALPPEAHAGDEPDDESAPLATGEPGPHVQAEPPSAAAPASTPVTPTRPAARWRDDQR